MRKRSYFRSTFLTVKVDKPIGDSPPNTLILIRKPNLMPNRSLRLFPDPSSDRRERELDLVAGVNEPQLVSVPLSTFTSLLTIASEKHHAWLHDFCEDTVQINSDLYEVLMAFQALQNESNQSQPRPVQRVA